MIKTIENFIDVNALTNIDNLKDTIDILKQVTFFLKDRKITYWIISATLLGTIRNKHIIPWVDDADISIYYDDLPKLLSLEKEMNVINIGLSKEKDRYKLYKLNSANKYPFVDVFPVVIDNNIIIYKNTIARQNLIKEFFYIDELLPSYNIKNDNNIIYPISLKSEISLSIAKELR